MGIHGYLGGRLYRSQEPLEQIRMESVAEILQQLRQDFRITGVPPTKEGRRLSDQVRAVTPLPPL